MINHIAMDNLQENDDEGITPLKRRRKQRKNSTKLLIDGDLNKPNQDATKNASSSTKNEEDGSCRKLKKKDSNEDKQPHLEQLKNVEAIDNNKNSADELDHILHNGIFCSKNNKADMQYFKPKKELPPSDEKLVFCPVCKIHLGFLHGNSPQAHINDCLDRGPEFEKGYCSGDSTCSLANVNHFREYKHEKVSSESTETGSNDDQDDQLKANSTEETDDYVCVIPEEKCSETISKKNDTEKQNNLSNNLTQTSIHDFFGGKKPKPKPKPNHSNIFASKENWAAGKSTAQHKKKRTNVRKECPFYKKIPGTHFTVDAFCYGDIEGCTAYFLSHFHSDHYGGLKKSFDKKLFCSKITANLVQCQIKVSSEYIHVLPMGTTVDVEGVKVTLIDANHCPGAVMFLMDLPNNKRILHVGDFRAHSSMLINPFICSKPINTIYLDTTYCNQKYTFPPQSDVIDFVVQTTRTYLKENKKTLFVCGTYSVGKEKVFKAIAIDRDIKIGVTKAKYNLLNCFDDEELAQRLTLDYTEAQLHILSLGKLNFKTLHEHFETYKSCGYNRVLAFKPTGWTFRNTFSSVHDIKPITHGAVTIFGVPYSEHSSFDELKMFINGLRPKHVIPTVNNGKKESRDEMNGYFQEWLSSSNNVA